jgi:hypothetical protein
MAMIIPDIHVVCLTYQCHALVQEAVQHHGAFFIGYDRYMTEEAYGFSGMKPNDAAKLVTTWNVGTMQQTLTSWKKKSQDIPLTAS